MNKYIFDVDGTLTPSRGKIDSDFKDWFSDFCISNDVYFVTGSDYPKTEEQLGEELCCKARGVYNCSGNVLTVGDEVVQSSNWKAPHAIYELLNGWLQASQFPLRTGTHIEERSGMINFSIIGRGCNRDERAEYVKWDRANRERETIAHIINTNFEDVTATVGGETGIDIHQTGADKSQILRDFDLKKDKIYFFGDRMEQGGNDYPLAKANVTGVNHHVKDWKHTWELLKFYEEGK